MKVEPITPKYITPKTTGYTALTAVGLTMLSGYSKDKTLRKMHKPFAIVACLASLFHICQIEYNHYIWKHKK